MKSAFHPIVNAESKILILGSMPGEVSLAAGQYYAFTRNSFWKIMGELVGAVASLSYEQRLDRLQKSGIALWDVIAACEREGSLDSSINEESLVANDFEAFLDAYPSIEQICFNGKSVQRLFKRHVLKLQTLPSGLGMTVLPSTSPANARLSFEQKLKAWRVIADIRLE